MDKGEFREWLDTHMECFPGLVGWLDRMTKGENAPTRSGILKQWFFALCHVDKTAAIKASRAMHAGDIEEPKGFDRHPMAIRQACGISKESLLAPWDHEKYDDDGNRLYCCLTCMDEGLVFCWHEKTVKAAIDQQAGKVGKSIRFNQMVVPCNCKAGARWRRETSPVFNDGQHLPLRRFEDGKEMIGCTADKNEQERLFDWVAGRMAEKKVTYSEFEAFA